MAEGRPEVRAVISDFGGVLTTPLLQSFMAFQNETGISAENLGMAMQAIAEARRREPAVRAGAGRDHRGRLPASASPTGSSRCSATARTCTASARSTSRRWTRTQPMIELMRELKADRLPDGDADQQRARVGAAVALDAAGRRDLRDRRRLGLRRLPQARPADLRDHRWSESACRPRPACSSTTSWSTAKGPQKRA